MTARNDDAAEEIVVDISHIQTEDDAPMDSLFAEREARLLVDSLYASWKPSASFLACDNVGIFYGLYLPPIAPDMFVSLDVAPPQREQVHEKRRRSYFVWEYGKPPDVVVEILSPSYRGEFDEKMKTYASVGVSYYVIHDPANYHAKKPLTCYELQGKRYAELASGKLTDVGLEASLWNGTYNGIEGEWLRWRDAAGNLLPTGAELAERERQRAERLAAELRKMGVDPDKI